MADSANTVISPNHVVKSSGSKKAGAAMASQKAEWR